MSCSADYYLEWNSRLNGRFFATKNHKKMHENILLLTLEALTLVGATNIGSTDYSALPTLAAPTIQR